jgi:hypothetical protein
MYFNIKHTDNSSIIACICHCRIKLPVLANVNQYKRVALSNGHENVNLVKDVWKIILDYAFPEIQTVRKELLIV